MPTRPPRVRVGETWMHAYDLDAGHPFSTSIGVHNDYGECLPLVPRVTSGGATREQTKTYAALPNRAFVVKCKKLTPSPDRYGGKVYIDQGEYPPTGSEDHDFWFPETRDCESEREAREYTIDGYCIDAQRSRDFVFKEWLDAGVEDSLDLINISKKVGWIVVRFHRVQQFTSRQRGQQAEPPTQVRRTATARHRSRDVKQLYSTAPGEEVFDPASDENKIAVLCPEVLFECKLHYKPAMQMLSEIPACGDKDFFKFLPMEVLLDEDAVRTQILSSMLRLTQCAQEPDPAGWGGESYVTLQQLVRTINLYMCKLGSQIICRAANDQSQNEARYSVVQGHAVTASDLEGTLSDEHDPFFKAKVAALVRLYTSPRYSLFYDLREEGGYYKIRAQPIVLEEDEDD